jgi:hypothetical protein
MEAVMCLECAAETARAKRDVQAAWDDDDVAMVDVLIAELKWRRGAEGYCPH